MLFPGIWRLFDRLASKSKLEGKTVTETKALRDAIKLLADAAKDTAAIAATGGNPLAAFLAYRNLVPDVLALAPELGLVGPEAKALTAADYPMLVDELVADLGLPAGHVKDMIEAAVPVLNAGLGGLLPALEKLFKIAHTAPADAAPAADAAPTPAA